jgi:arylsulfatase A-like enzyme
LDRGFAEFKDFPVSAASVLSSPFLARALMRPYRRVIDDATPIVRKSAADVNAEFLSWLSSHPASPFFAFLNYFDAHSPNSPPSSFQRKFGSNGKVLDLQNERHHSAENIRRFADAYDDGIAYMDEQMGALLDALNAKGILDKTLVVITADHGEQLGEHGFLYHGNTLYRPSLTVPLLLRLPGRVPAAMRISTPVSLVDLPATILDLAGLADDHAPLPGTTLAIHWRNHAQQVRTGSPLLSEVSRVEAAGDWLPVSKGSMRSLVADGFHYIRNGDGREELYDFEHDLEEEHDLSDRPEHRQDIERLRKMVEDASGRR